MKKAVKWIIAFLTAIGITTGLCNDTGLCGTSTYGYELPEDSYFTVKFLDVGEGDASLIVCDDHAMLIDGGESSKSQYIYTILKEEGIDHLDYIVSTHPDADHIGGLSAAMSFASVDVALGTGESKETRAYSSFVKKLDEQGIELTVPDSGDTFSLGSASVIVLGPEKNKIYSDNTSIVLRICYGETSFLFTGDCEKEDEEYLIKSGYESQFTGMVKFTAFLI